MHFSHGDFVVRFLISSRASHRKDFSMETVDSFYVRKKKI